jgi:hypothetical protein
VVAIVARGQLWIEIPASVLFNHLGPRVIDLVMWKSRRSQGLSWVDLLVTNDVVDTLREGRGGLR